MPEPIPATPPSGAPPGTPPTEPLTPPSPSPAQEGTPPTEPPKGPGGIYSSDNDGTPPPAQGNWPDEWRAQVSGDSEKMLNWAARYGDPAAALKAGFEATQKIGSGEWNRRPPEGADEKTMTEWREQAGVPAEKDAYTFKLPEGYKDEDLTDRDREIQAGFRDVFHQRNFTQTDVDAVMDVTTSLMQQQQEAQATADGTAADAAEDALRADWGPDFRANRDLNAQYLSDQFGEDWEMIVQARTPNGMRLMDMPEHAKWINQQARADGGTTLESGVSVTRTVGEARIKEIEQIMSTDYSKYGGDAEMQKEYGRLLSARDGGRGGE